MEKSTAVAAAEEEEEEETEVPVVFFVYGKFVSFLSDDFLGEVEEFRKKISSLSRRRTPCLRDSSSITCGSTMSAFFTLALEEDEGPAREEEEESCSPPAMRFLKLVGEDADFLARQNFW